MKNTKAKKPLHPQTSKVLSIYQSGKSLTRLSAMHYGIMNITARNSELRQAGYPVLAAWKKDMNGKRYGSFYLDGHA